MFYFDNDFYYHYTNNIGMRGIRDSLYIFQSLSSIFGDGVYLTKLSPLNRTKILARNNFRFINDISIQKCHFAIKISANSIDATKIQDSFGRNVFKHEGCIDLTDIPFEIIQVGGRNRVLFSHFG
jgi:hypothetical protein